ncbi:Athe_2463 domain-containing protein, partial [Phosphitispora fastidiosa]|uniref:Athe_2463 domain-containing protein n=1 Tax=Phosphitispora fastidiosa TaxID=2837202 RepID=UPI003EBA9864|nr:hypothetical protein [Phosphitispora fastidiosa]
MKILQSTIIFAIMLIFMPLLAYGAEYDSYIPLKSPPNDVDSAMNDDNKYLNREYFVHKLPIIKNLNLNGEELRIIYYDNSEHMLVWGNEHGDYLNGVYRYLGINALGENITNIDWPLDVPINPGAKLDDNCWIKFPWESNAIRQKLISRGESPISRSPWDGDTRFLPNIVKGLQAKHTAEFRGAPELTWTDYVHILQPPTYYGWGVGRAWHIKNGEIL